MENSMGNLQKMGASSLGDPFKKRGGIFGLAILACCVGLVIFNIGAILAFAQNLLGLVVCGVATAAILYVAFDKNFRLLLSTWYMIQVTKALGLFVKMNPIIILKDGIKKMYNKIAEMEASMSKLNGVRLKLRDKVQEKKKEVQDCADTIKTCEKMNKTDQALVEKRQLYRLTNLVNDYQKMLDSSEKWYSTMNKISEMAKLYAQDSENEVDAQEERFKSAMSVIKGDPDELAIYNQAFQFVNDDIMNRVGEMDRVVNTAGGLLDKIDVEKEMFGIKGDDLMNKYNDLGIEGMFNGLSTPPTTLSLMRGEQEAEKLPVQGNYTSPKKAKYL